MYSYKESSTALLTESIQLYADRYYGDGQLAFKINISSDTANIHFERWYLYIFSLFFS